MSDLPDSKQPEDDGYERVENPGGGIQTDEDGTGEKWYLVSDASGETGVLLHPDGSGEALCVKISIMQRDDESGRIFAIVAREGDAP